MTISPSPDKVQPLKLSYDGKLTIAEGRSRKETTWKHRELLWGQLLNKVSVTRRTGETDRSRVDRDNVGEPRFP